jgi:hypothetical protein
MKYRRAMFLFTGLVLFHAAFAATDNTLTVRDAWIREAPPGAQVLAGYAQIENVTDQADAIVEVSSDAFEKAEIHHSEVKDGVARMAQLKRFDLPAHKIVKLDPGGAHLMLFNPKLPLHAGQHVRLNFKLRSGKTLNLDAEVRNTVQRSEHQHEMN